jgi:hypothetical protein
MTTIERRRSGKNLATPVNLRFSRSRRFDTFLRVVFIRYSTHSVLHLRRADPARQHASAVDP